MRIDPVFSEAISMLFGDAVDVREAWDNVSKMDDASEVHVPGNLKVVGKKPRKFGVKPNSSNKIVKNPINSQNSTALTGVNSQRTVTNSGVSNATIQSGAVGKSFETTWTGEISKVDADKRQVFGWCSLSEINGEPVVDLQGDYVPIAEIEKSAYTYVLTSRKGGDMHERDGEMPLHTADMIESFVVTPEKLEKMGLPKDSLPLGWWVGFKVNDDKQWADVKDLKRTGFSIHGKGSRVEKVL